MSKIAKNLSLPTSSLETPHNIPISTLSLSSTRDNELTAQKKQVDPM